MSQIFHENGVVIPVTVLNTKEEITPDLEGKEVTVTGKSKGKGFTGVMKKWGFHGGPATRGQGIKQRSPGSIGAQTPGRVFKGKQMAGRNGGKKVTIKNLKIVKVFPKEKNLMVSGPVPGSRNSEIIIKVAVEG